MRVIAARICEKRFAEFTLPYSISMPTFLGQMPASISIGGKPQ
jgi:hypothetical protein